jgi:two-component system chemotaxis response regulator CheB
MPKHDIVVIGASSGGIEAVKTILRGLPSDLAASIFITIHTHPTGGNFLAPILARVSSLPVRIALDNEKIEPGRVYIAPPNLHLTIKRGYLTNRFKPKENGTRPAIDPMFRSAAFSYAKRVIGVLLTGNLDDGTAGLGIIQDEGGLVIVQDPNDALYPDMPLTAIRSVKPDYITPVAEIAPLLVDLIGTETTTGEPTKQTETKEVGPVMTCPGCGGVLTEYANDKVIWYQCQVGHRFTSESMMLQQNVVAEEYFWRMLSILKEKENVARTMAADARSTLTSLVDPEYFDKQAEASVEAQKLLYSILERLGPILFPGIPEKPEKDASEDSESSEK